MIWILVIAVWIDYSTLTCDQGWINNLMALSDGLRQVLDGRYSDISFEVDNKTIKAHKVIVSRCKYFEAMLDGDNVESSTGVVEISDFSFDIIHGLLVYVYSGHTRLSDVIFAIDLRMAADKYNLPDLVKRCEDYIAKEVKPSNVAFQKIIMSPQFTFEELISN